MRASDYNKFLAAIKHANDQEPSVARELLRGIQAEMIDMYGRDDNDVDYLIRQFRFHLDL